jgi:hypothetical protein
VSHVSLSSRTSSYSHTTAGTLGIVIALVTLILGGLITYLADFRVRFALNDQLVLILSYAISLGLGSVAVAISYLVSSNNFIHEKFKSRVWAILLIVGGGGGATLILFNYLEIVGELDKMISMMPWNIR